MKIRRTIPAVLAALACALSVAAQSPQTATREPLTVMSFNIRYGTANDGDNHWTLRREFLFDVMREADADLVGLQEALDAQIAALLQALPQYGVVGVGRDDGRTRGEYAAILYRRDRFRVSDAGTFWFSDTPEVVASRSWGNNITRICTWARFVDRDGQAFWHYNVHLDHESQPSRERSTALLADRIAARRAPTEPVIVTGDFNVGETNPALTRLMHRCRMRPRRSSIPSASAIRTSRAPARSTASSSGKPEATRLTTCSSLRGRRCSMRRSSARAGMTAIRLITFR